MVTHPVHAKSGGMSRPEPDDRLWSRRPLYVVFVASAGGIAASIVGLPVLAAVPGAYSALALLVTACLPVALVSGVIVLVRRPDPATPPDTLRALRQIRAVAAALVGLVVVVTALVLLLIAICSGYSTG